MIKLRSLLLVAALSACGGGSSAPYLASIAITPTAASVPMGRTQQFTATAIYSDSSRVEITRAATWSSGTPTVASVDARSGLASGLKTGTSVIKATYADGASTVSASVDMSVAEAVVQSISIAPNPAYSGVGLVLQLTATGTFSDGTLADVSALSSWSTSAPAVASVAATSGVTRGAALGTATITATIGSVTATTPLSIVAGVWSQTGALAEPLGIGVATLLGNGKVLLSATGKDHLDFRYRGQLYDPVTNRWSATGNLGGGYEASVAVLLPSGQVLFAGGRPSTRTWTSQAWLYEPHSGSTTATGRMSVERTGVHTLTLLPNGKVLAVGSVADTIAPYIFQAELFDPARGPWSLTADSASERFGHTATLLANGKVLVAGGGCRSLCPAGSVELYDSVHGTWAPAGTPSLIRSYHTATLLPDGRVLVVGGQATSDVYTSLATAEIFDPVGGTWSPTGALSNARRGHSATLLPNGKVLVAGGTGSGGDKPLLASTEIYDPATGTWSPGAELGTASADHSALRLPNGKVLVIKAVPELYW